MNDAGLPRDVWLGLTKAEDVAYPLRWGIIGAGDISRQWTIASRECSGATIAAVAARDGDKAKAFAEQHGIEQAYGGYENMLASPDIDVVYVGTIDRLHKEHCLMAIEAGKHLSLIHISEPTRRATISRMPSSA